MSTPTPVIIETMGNTDKNMKVTVMTMPSEDAVQLALDRYDLEPNSKQPKKLLNNTPVDLVAVTPTDLPKTFSNRNLVEVNLGELLGLGVLGQYYHYFDKDKLWDVVLGLEDVWKPHTEAVLSDGALKENGQTARMTVQQVMAQDYFNKSGHSLEDILIEKIKDKEARRSDYPEKCVLLASVYSKQGGLDFKRVMDECDMSAFDLYFCIIYQLPSLEQCLVIHLDKNASPEQFIKSRIPFELVRYENPYGSADDKDNSSGVSTVG